jgi:hypothetical protein
MVPTETKEIDGMVFRVGALELRAERALLVRLVKLLGPAIAELSNGSAADAITALLAKLDEKEVDTLVETFRPITQARMELANGGEQWVPCLDSFFKKGASSQFKWLWFCLEHQFGNFLGSGAGKLETTLDGILTKLKAKASGSTSPQT